MTENFNITPVIPGAQTPEGCARISDAVQRRSDVDFRAYQLLVRLADEGYLDRHRLVAVLIDDGLTKEEISEEADAILLDLREIRRDRRDADHEVLSALAGR